MRKIICLFLICVIVFPSMVISAREATTIAGGQGSSFVIMADGSLWAFGQNAYGQLGDGTDIMRQVPVWVMDDVVAVSARGRTSMAIRNDGTLWAWGRNIKGQVETGHSWYSINPVQIMDNVISVSVGHTHAAAIRADGSLWMWGSNSSGQIGDGTFTEWGHSGMTLLQNNERQSPIRVMEDVVAVTTGSGTTMAIRTDDSLWIWGVHGLSDRSVWRPWYPTPVQIAEDIAAFSAGDHHNMIIGNDGILWAWGGNWAGQIGDGTASSYGDNDRFDFVRIMDSVVSVSAGNSHTIAIREDGSLWVWGMNALGEGEDAYIPVKLMENMVAVAMDAQHNLAIDADGSLWTWGNNWGGQLGNPEFGVRTYTPKRLLDSVMLPGNVPIRIIINGQLVALDVAPVIINDRTMVPFRAIFEAFGMDVEWDSDVNTAIGISEGFRIELPIGVYTAYINGEREYLDTPAIIHDDRTLVPLRFVAESIGAEVVWDGTSRVIRISVP